MSENLHNIDDLFKKALDNNTELPSENAWDNIDKSLDKKKVISISKKYKNLKWIAAVLLLFSLGMAMYTLHISNQNKELVRQNSNGKKLIPDKNQSGIRNSFNISTVTAENKNIPSNLLVHKKSGNDSANSGNNKNLVIEEDNNVVTKKPLDINSNSKKSQTDLSEKENDVKENTSSIKSQEIRHQAAKDYAQTTTTGADRPDVSSSETSNIKLKNNVNKTQKSANITTTHKRFSTTTETPEMDTYNDALSSTTTTQKSINGAAALPDIKNYEIIPEKQKLLMTNDDLLLLNNTAKNYKKSLLSKKSLSNKINKSPFSLMAFYSPDIISDKEADDDDHPRFMEEERNEIKKDEKIKLSSTTGLLVSYNLNSKWQVQSGITFSSRKTDIRPKTIYARPDNNGNVNYRLNCSAGYSYINLNSIPMPASGDSLMALSSKNTLNYVGVPIALRYVLTTSKWNLIPEVGTSFNFLTKGNITTTTQQPQTADKNITSAKIQGLKSSYVDGLVGFAAQYNFSKLLAVSFQPTLRFALSSINNDAPVKTNLNSVGFIAGLVIKL